MNDRDRGCDEVLMKRGKSIGHDLFVSVRKMFDSEGCGLVSTYS